MLKNKKLLILTSLLILLPIPVFFLLKNQLPQEIVPSFAAFFYTVPPCVLAGHWLCTYFSGLDKSNQGRNEKIQQLVLWILPLITNFLCGILLVILLGGEASFMGLSTLFFGLLFALIGNYLPKTRMNSTMGIKIKWTYSSDENWNALPDGSGLSEAFC